MALTLLLAAAAPAAHAELQRVGPVDAFHFGFPAWYQDKTGITLDLCTPGNQAELDSGWCVILPADVPGGLAPELFPTNFAGEHFYWLASTGTNPTGLLVLALEAGFGGGDPLPGDQIVFGRLRIKLNAAPVTGDYKVYTPFGVFNFPGVPAGERIFFTSDIGIACPGSFECALNSNIGPFLLPSATAGGPELPPTTFPGTGRKYVADPGRIGPVTGSTLPPFVSAVDGQTYNHNRLRIEGFNPATAQHFLVTDQTAFSMAGRIKEDTIPGVVSVKRASYGQTATANKLDVFATAFPTTQGRLPAAAVLPPINPILAFYDAPCATDPVTGAITGPPVGAPVHSMFQSGTNWWGGNAPAVIPPQVCVQDAATAALFLRDVTDEVDITVRSWDPALNGGTLTVAATSSDQVAVPTLTAVGFGAIDPVTHQLQVSNLAAPPSSVTVLSNRGGLAALDVRTGVVPGPVTPVANADSVTMNEDCSALPALSCATPPAFDVLANDTLGGAAFPPGTTVAITTPPQAGTATVNPDNTIRYTPNPNASGTRVVGYTVTANGLTSNEALLTVVITPVNDNPVANNDTVVTLNNVSVTINALANDTDPDGQAELADAVIASLPGAGATLTCNGGVAASVGTVCTGGVLAFTSTVPGPFTFTYQAQDQALALSAIPAAVTVTVNASAQAPVANAGAAKTAGSNKAVQLDGSASSDPNVPAQALTYAWTQTAFGQCTAVACPPMTLSNSATAAPAFTAPLNTKGKSTVLTFSLKVTNTSLLTSAASLVNVTVNPVLAPVANAGLSQSVLIDSTVQLDGSLSSDPNGLPITYLWTAGGGVTLSSRTVANPTFTAPGNTTQFDISLKVSNGFISSNTSKVTINVN